VSKIVCCCVVSRAWIQWTFAMASALNHDVDEPRSFTQGPWPKDILPKSLAQGPKTRGPRDAVQCSRSNSSRAVLCAVSVRRVEHPLPPLSIRLLSILFFKFVCHLLNQTLGSIDTKHLCDLLSLSEIRSNLISTLASTLISTLISTPPHLNMTHV